MRGKCVPLQAQATELAAAIIAEEEELLLLRAQVKPLISLSWNNLGNSLSRRSCRL